jgi:hypothetical protein
VWLVLLRRQVASIDHPLALLRRVDRRLLLGVWLRLLRIVGVARGYGPACGVGRVPLAADAGGHRWWLRLVAVERLRGGGPHAPRPLGHLALSGKVLHDESLHALERLPQLEHVSVRLLLSSLEHFDARKNVLPRLSHREESIHHRGGGAVHVAARGHGRLH